MRVLLVQGWSWVGTSDTSGFPASRGDPSLHPHPWPERGPGWLEQDRQGQEGCQRFQSHVAASHNPWEWDAAPRPGSAGRGAWWSVGHSSTVPEHSHFSLALFCGHGAAGQVAAPALTPKLGVSPAPSHILTLCWQQPHPSTKGGSPQPGLSKGIQVLLHRELPRPGEPDVVLEGEQSSLKQAG